MTEGDRNRKRKLTTTVALLILDSRSEVKVFLVNEAHQNISATLQNSVEPHVSRKKLIEVDRNWKHITDCCNSSISYAYLNSAIIHCTHKLQSRLNSYT
jgi:hypothetical protein